MTILGYTLNYVDFIIVGIGLLFFVTGCIRGLFVTVLNFIRYIVGFSLCVFSADRFTEPFYNGIVKNKIVDVLSQKVVTSTNVDEIMNNLNEAVNSLPSFMQNAIDLSKIPISSSEDIALSLANNIFEPVALVVIRILIFIATFVVFFGITGIIILFIRKRKKAKRAKKGIKGGLNKVDSILGGFFGFLKGLVVIFVFVSIVTMISNVDGLSTNKFIIEAQNSGLYNMILSINPFNLITEGII